MMIAAAAPEWQNFHTARSGDSITGRTSARQTCNSTRVVQCARIVIATRQWAPAGLASCDRQTWKITRKKVAAPATVW